MHSIKFIGPCIYGHKRGPGRTSSLLYLRPRCPPRLLRGGTGRRGPRAAGREPRSPLFFFFFSGREERESALLHRENVPQILMRRGFRRGTADQRPAFKWPSATLQEGVGRSVGRSVGRCVCTLFTKCTPPFFDEHGFFERVLGAPRRTGWIRTDIHGL